MRGSSKLISWARGRFPPCLFVALWLAACGGARGGEAGPEPLEALFAQASNLNLHPRERWLARREICDAGAKAMSFLARQLTDEKSVRRQTAALLLGELGDARAEAGLLQVATGEDFIAGGFAQAALLKIYCGLDEAGLLARSAGSAATEGIFRDLPPVCLGAVRRLALAALAERYGRAGAPALPPAAAAPAAVALGDNDPQTRAAAAAVLGLADGDAANRLLARLGIETEPQVLCALCEALARLRPAAGMGAVKPLTAHADGLVRLESTYALYAAGLSNTPDAVSAFLSDGAPETQLRAIELLGRVGGAAGVAALAPAMADRSWVIRLAAVQALSRIKGRESLLLAQKAFADGDVRVRTEAAIILAGDESGVGAKWALLENLKGNDPAARLEAARAFAAVKCDKAIRELAQCLGDADLELACRAAEALAFQGGAAAEKLLYGSLGDRRGPVARLAREGLKRLKNNDPGGDPKQWPDWAKAHGVAAE